MSLKNKLLWSICGIVIFAILTAAVFSTVVVNSLFKAAVLKPALAVSREETAQMEKTIKRIRDFLRKNAPFVEGNVVLGICPSSLLHRLSSQEKEVEELYLVLTKELDQECPEAFTLQEIKFSWKLPWKLQGNTTPYVGGIGKDPLSGKRVVVVFQPLRDQGGALVATVSLDWLLHDMRILPSFTEGLVMLDQQGNCVAFTKAGFTQEQRETVCKDLVKQILQGRKGQSASVFIEGKKIRVFLNKIPSTTLYLGTIVANSSLMESKNTIILLFLLLIVIGVSGAVFFTNLFGNNLLERVKRMVRFADTISSGRYTVRLHPCGGDELGHLCHTLNIMAQCLEDYERRYLEAQSRLKKMYQEKKEQAERDPLTGRYNHGKLYDLLENEIKRVNRYGGELSVVLFDLNHFKEINDTYGHLVGDEALKLFSNILKENSRDTDIVGRYGGDEFMVVMPNTSEEDAQVFAERVAEKLSTVSLPVEDKNLKLEVSFGVASYPSTRCQEGSLNQCIKLLISTADERMYHHKKHLKEKRWRTHH